MLAVAVACFYARYETGNVTLYVTKSMSHVKILIAQRFLTTHIKKCISTKLFEY